MLWIGQVAVATLPTEIDVTNAEMVRENLLAVLNQGAILLVADLSSDCVLGEDKIWRYETHVLQPIFVGSDIPLSISIDTQILAEDERGSRKQA